MPLQRRNCRGAARSLSLRLSIPMPSRCRLQSMRSLTGALWSVAFVCVAAPGCGRTQPSHAADGGMASDASMRLQPPSGGRSSAGSGGSAPTGAGRAAPASGAGGQTDDLDAGTPPTRPLLATSGAQLVISGPQLGLQLTAANLAEDADLFAVHQEFYGIPWAAFEAGTPPPPPSSPPPTPPPPPPPPPPPRPPPAPPTGPTCSCRSRLPRSARSAASSCPSAC